MVENVFKDDGEQADSDKEGLREKRTILASFRLQRQLTRRPESFQLHHENGFCNLNDDIFVTRENKTG
tara:strand:+ start:441 stop:644 length:204 start_codon:yes stop_codon:yes gene_type:complete